MKSHFSTLSDINYTLYEVAYSAENLFVNNQYHYIPTALRIFTEGIMKEILQGQAEDGIELIGLIRCFEQNYYGENTIVGAAHRLRIEGNSASHFKPRVLKKGELINLFEESIRLLNFYLKSYLKQDVGAVQFSLDNLPEPLLEVVTSEEFQTSEKYVNKETKEKIEKFKKDNVRLNRELTTYKSALVQAEKKSSLVNKEKLLLQNTILTLENKHSELLMNVNEPNEHSLNIKNNEVQDEIISLKHQVDSLEKQNKLLNQEKSVFEAKVIDNEAQQAAQTPLKTEITKAIGNDRKASLISKLSIVELNDQQQQLADIYDGLHYLSAPPGAGKTAMLTKRLQKAVDLFDCKYIACLTFTTRAANEMNERASPFLGERTPFIGNFHNLCLDLIRNSNELALKVRFSTILPELYRNEFYSKAVKLANCQNAKEEDIKVNIAFSEFVRELISQKGDGFKVEERTRFDKYLFFKLYPYLNIIYSTQDNDLVEFARQHLKKVLPTAIIACHKSIFGSHNAIDMMRGAKYLWLLLDNFIQLKQSAKSIDYDDILCLGLIELTLYPQKKSFIQVDEVQDLNAIQWKIIQALATKNTHVFVVGDKQQSIYSFLGASLEALESETQKFEQHTLETNYRSNKQIVSFLNCYREKVWGLPPISAQNPDDSELATMLIKYNTQERELFGVHAAINKILQDKKRSIGLLLPTNNSVELFCNFFDEYRLNYFRVSAKDIMQHEVIQDWFSIMKVHTGNENRVDWYNLIYRFTRSDFNENDISLDQVMDFVDRLSSTGISISDVISDNLHDENLFQYRIKYLKDSWSSESVIIFDASKNDQLAAIKFHNCEITETYEQVIDGKECDINRNRDALNEFLDFIGNDKLISHNLNLTNARLRSWIKAVDDYDLESRFNKVTRSSQFDSLSLTKYLLPNESSYKLEDLLNTYELDFEKGDDALSYVKATSSLMPLLIKKTKEIIPQLDSIIDEHQLTIFLVKTNLQKVNNLLRSYYASGAEVSLSEILMEWLEYAFEQRSWYPDCQQKPFTKEIKGKLVKWLDKNQYRGHIHELFDDLDPKIQQLYTLKEADLIDSSQYKLVVSTIHRSKGLEFETVIIPMVTNHYYPGWQPDDTPKAEKLKNNEEKKRLLYVALSRPTNKLIVTYHLQGGERHAYNTELYDEIAKCIGVFSYKG